MPLNQTAQNGTLNFQAYHGIYQYCVNNCDYTKFPYHPCSPRQEESEADEIRQEGTASDTGGIQIDRRLDWPGHRSLMERLPRHIYMDLDGKVPLFLKTAQTVCGCSRGLGLINTVARQDRLLYLTGVTERTFI